MGQSCAFDLVVPLYNVFQTDFGKSHENNWGSTHIPTYLMLKKGVDVSAFEPKLAAFFEKRAGEESIFNLVKALVDEKAAAPIF